MVILGALRVRHFELNWSVFFTDHTLCRTSQETTRPSTALLLAYMPLVLSLQPWADWLRYVLSPNRLSNLN